MIETPDVPAMVEVAAHLDPDEDLLWAGRPETGLKLRWWDVVAIPFAIVFTTFSVVWEGLAGYAFVSAVREGGWNACLVAIFPLFGIPFLFASANLLVLRFFTDARLRERTRYALTASRVVIVEGDEVKAAPLPRLGELRVRERADGTGSLAFLGTTTRIGGRDTGTLAFEYVEDVREVERLVRAAVADAPRR